MAEDLSHLTSPNNKPSSELSVESITNGIGYTVAGAGLLPDLSGFEETHPPPHVSVQTMQDCEKQPLSVYQFCDQAEQFLDHKKQWFNGYSRPLRRESRAIREELRAIMNQSNSSVKIITYRSQPFGWKMIGNFDYLQLPSVTVQVLARHQQLFAFVDHLKKNTPPNISIDLPSIALTQQFKEPVQYVSLKFSTLPPLDCTESKVWEIYYDYVETQWWEDVVRTLRYGVTVSSCV